MFYKLSYTNCDWFPILYLDPVGAYVSLEQQLLFGVQQLIYTCHKYSPETDNIACDPKQVMKLHGSDILSTVEAFSLIYSPWCLRFQIALWK